MLILWSSIALGAQAQPLRLWFFESLRLCANPNIGAPLLVLFQVSTIVKCQHSQPSICDLRYDVIDPHGTSRVVTCVTHIPPLGPLKIPKLPATCPYQNQSYVATCPARGERKGCIHLSFCDEILCEPLSMFHNSFIRNRHIMRITTFYRLSHSEVPICWCFNLL